MPNGGPKSEKMIRPASAGNVPKQPHEQSLSLPPAPDHSPLALDESKGTTASPPIEFDQRIRAYGEQIKVQLAQNTPKNSRGASVWEPYHIHLDNIPEEYHERVAYYVLQTYKLPEVEKHIAYNANTFKGIDKTALAQALLQRHGDGIRALALNLNKFRGADEEIIYDVLSRAVLPEYWIKDIDFFKTIPHLRIAQDFIALGATDAFVEHFDRFRFNDEDYPLLVHTICQDFPKSGYSKFQSSASALVAVLHKFRHIDPRVVMEQAIASDFRAALEVLANLPRYSDIRCDTFASVFRDAVARVDWKKTSPTDTDTDTWILEKSERISDYFLDYEALPPQERARRLLAISPGHICKYLNLYPTLSHREIALAAANGRPEDLSQLIKAFSDFTDLTEEDKREIVETTITANDRNCTSILFAFKALKGLDPLALADRILKRRPSAFLETNHFLGLRPTDILKRLLSNGDTHTAILGMLKDGVVLKWIRLGDHDPEVARAFIRCGMSRLVIENIPCFNHLSPEDKQTAALDAVLCCIRQGRVDSAHAYTKTYSVPIENIHAQLVRQLQTDLASSKLSREALLRTIGAAAWSLYHPDLLHSGLTQQLKDMFEPYRKLLGTGDKEQLERNAKQKLLENLVSKGVPLLLQLNWLRPDTVKSLSAILPTFLDSTTGSTAAWDAHYYNLGTWPKFSVDWEKMGKIYALRALASRNVSAPDIGAPNSQPSESNERFLLLNVEYPALQSNARPLLDDLRQGLDDWLLATESPFVGDDLDPAQELASLREFYRNFGVAQAPTLYKQWHQQQVADAHGQANKKAEFRESLSYLHDLLGREGPCDIDGLAPEHIEYLAMWTRIKPDPLTARLISNEQPPNPSALIERISRFNSAWANPLMKPKDSRLKARTMAVFKADSTVTEWSSILTATYLRFKERLEAIRAMPVDALFHQEKSVAKEVLSNDYRKRRAWLDEREAQKIDEGDITSARHQLANIEKYLALINASDSPGELVELLCELNDSRFKTSVATLAIRMGLDNLLDGDGFIDSLLDVPSQNSVQAIVEFLATSIKGEVLGPMKEARKTIHTVKKYLNQGEFLKALKQQHAGDPVVATDFTIRQQGDPIGEILVLPTRSILGEIAGFFSEACWTDNYKLLEYHQNATALVFLRRHGKVPGKDADNDNPDLKDTELLGACYILLVKDTNGEDVLVLRGINPRERACRNVDMERFIEALLDDVVVPYAKVLGATKVVVPFDSLGHAQTNRHAINAWLDRRYANAEYVPLDPKGPNSHFNDRRIFDLCRLVRLIT
jgi:hypothetical protein